MSTTMSPYSFITNHNPKPVNCNQEHTHTTCNNWNKIHQIKALHIKKEKRFTLKSLLRSCGSLIPTKLLLILDTTLSYVQVAYK
jgi:hypothetical protein